MPINITMPALSPTMEEGALTKWMVGVGDQVSSGDVIAEIETDKATMEVEAADEGVVARLLVAEGAENVKVNEVIAVLLEEGEAPDEADTASPAPQMAEAQAPSAPPDDLISAQPPTRVFATPLARRIAAEAGLAIGRVTGTGPKGRITKADVEIALKTPPPDAAAISLTSPQAATPAAVPTEGPTHQPSLAAYVDRPYREVALDGMRKTIAARLTEAKRTVPHFYLRRDIELDALISLRAELNQRLEPKGVKISINDFIVKACALALQDHPDCNVIWAGDRLLQFAPSDIAVAVAIDGGLITPVLRDAEAKSISALSEEMKDLAGRARDRKLKPHEYQGGAFAISNLGMFGVESFDAVINPPHGAILAVGAGIAKPVARGKQMEIATVMTVTLSVDHRSIDGAAGARLLETIKRYLEEPLAILA